ncbi:MAG: hypothetical protein ABI477_13555 [Chryseolinea sp.]
MSSGQLYALVPWPKKSSNAETGLNENVIRDFGLEVGLFDVKVCGDEKIVRT